MPVPAEPDAAPDKAYTPGNDPARYAAAAYLRELLLRPGRARRMWEQYAERNRFGQINQLAVAEVLARHLWHSPRRSGDVDILPRQLKDTAARALSGKLLSKATLALFIDAFRLPATECDHLWLLWEGSPQVKMLSGPRAMRPELMSDVATVLGPPGHQTLSLHDHVNIGADRFVSRTRTMQVIEAIRPGLDRIPYIYDASALTLEVGQGCRGAIEPLAEVTEGVYATSIPLAKTLDLGETLTLEYWTTYQGIVTYPDDVQQRQYRRAVMRRVENFDIRVEFDPEMLPAQVWWAVWDGVEGDIAEQYPVELDSQHSVHRYLRLVERTVIGFQWDW